MIRLIRFLITGDWHLHEWETIQEYECTKRKTTLMGNTDTEKSRIFVSKCKHCGNIKSTEITHEEDK